MEPEDIGNREIDFIVSDVSFISLKAGSGAGARFCRTGGLPRKLVGRSSRLGARRSARPALLKEPETAPLVAAELERWLTEDMGWESLGLIPSPIAGGDGNEGIPARRSKSRLSMAMTTTPMTTAGMTPVTRPMTRWARMPNERRDRDHLEPRRQG